MSKIKKTRPAISDYIVPDNHESLVMNIIGAGNINESAEGFTDLLTLLRDALTDSNGELWQEVCAELEAMMRLAFRRSEFHDLAFDLYSHQNHIRGGVHNAIDELRALRDAKLDRRAERQVRP